MNVAERINRRAYSSLHAIEMAREQADHTWEYEGEEGIVFTFADGSKLWADSMSWNSIEMDRAYWLQLYKARLEKEGYSTTQMREAMGKIEADLTSGYHNMKESPVEAAEEDIEVYREEGFLADG